MDGLAGDSGTDAHDLSRKLNQCSRQLIVTQLDEQFRFCVEVEDFIKDRVRLEDHEALRDTSSYITSDIHPSQLREKLAEVRMYVSDYAAQQRDLVEELRFEREMNRRKEKESDEDARDNAQRRIEADQLKTVENQHIDEEKRQEKREKREAKQFEDSQTLAELSIKIANQSFKIAQETRRDSQTMRGIAGMTMAFLPATFVSSFFGMNFFNGVPGTPAFDAASKNV